MHRENVLWYLRQKLQECGSFQASMMETRIMREMEKNKSVLYKARGKPMPELGGFDDAPVPPPRQGNNKAMHVEDQQPTQNPEDELSPEQLQMFEKENQDMMKHYEATLDQVRYKYRIISVLLEANYRIGPLRSLWWKYRSYKRNWSIIWPHSRRTLTSLWQTHFRRQRTWEEATRS